MLPEDVRGILKTHRHRDQLLEVVLDLGRRPEARFAGDLPNEFLRDEVISQADLDAAEASAGEAKLRVLATAKPDEGRKGDGIFVLSGLDARGADKELVRSVLAAVGGKGGGKSRVQGKLTALEGVASALALLNGALE